MPVRTEQLRRVEQSWFWSSIIISPPGFHLALVAFLAMAWGFWIWNPFWGQVIFDTSESYKILVEMIPPSILAGTSSETVWGGLFSVAGAALMFASIRKNVLLSQLSLCLLMFLWAVVAYSFAFSNFHSTGTVMYIGTVILHLVLYMRVFSDN